MDKLARIDGEKFKKNFYFGIDNKKGAKVGILRFASKKIYQNHSLENWYDIPNEQFENEILQEAVKKYKHFYRFVTVNDRSDNFEFNINEDELRKELEEEMQILKKEDKVFEANVGVFFRREIENELEWTKDIYEILEVLEETEQKDSDEYYKLWLFVKFSRAVNRLDREGAIKLKSLYENFQRNEEQER